MKAAELLAEQRRHAGVDAETDRGFEGRRLDLSAGARVGAACFGCVVISRRSTSVDQVRCPAVDVSTNRLISIFRRQNESAKEYAYPSFRPFFPMDEFISARRWKRRRGAGRAAFGGDGKAASALSRQCAVSHCGRYERSMQGRSR